MTRRLTSKQREELWNAEAAEARAQGCGGFPICHHCDLPVTPGQTWDAAHHKHKPRWLGGEIAGVAHSRCNRSHNNHVDTPKYAKAERQRKQFMDFTRPASPMQANRAAPFKIKLDGQVVDRKTGERWTWGGTKA